MRIGILTQPFHSNYGGLLQAYALQTVLQGMSHETLFLDRDMKYLHIRSLTQRIAYRCLILFFEITKGANYYIPNKRERKAIKKYTDIFVQKYIVKSPYLHSSKELRKYVKKHGFDAFVVGSDQVWRPEYSPELSNYFLDFAKDLNVLRIAYAASFGIDEWQFNEEQASECSNLAKLFDAISVREESGIILCKDYLGVDAIQVLDPTLLLDKESYVTLVNEANEQKQPSELFCYVLDYNNDVRKVIEYIASESSLTPFSIMPSKKCGHLWMQKWLLLIVFMVASLVLFLKNHFGLSGTLLVG